MGLNNIQSNCPQWWYGAQHVIHFTLEAIGNLGKTIARLDLIDSLALQPSHGRLSTLVAYNTMGSYETNSMFLHMISVNRVWLLCMAFSMLLCFAG